MTRKHWKNCSWISAKRGFYKPDRKRTRAAYTGPKKREKSIYEKAIIALLNPIIEFNCDESVSERRTFFKKILRKSKLFHSDSETTVKRTFAILFVLRTLEAEKRLLCVQSIQKEAADLFSV